ncbi:MAG: GAF domain-containing protein [Anaerolineae bacterium]
MTEESKKTNAQLRAELKTLRRENIRLRQELDADDEGFAVPRRSPERLELLSQIVQQMKDAVILTEANPESRICYVNDAFTDLYGYEKEEILGQPSWMLFGGDLGEKERLQKERAICIREDGECRLTYQDRRKDGSRFWVTNTLSVVRVGDKTYNLGIVRDISDQRRVTTELRRRTAEMEALRQLGMELTAELDLETLLDAIVERALELIGGRAGLLGLYDSEDAVFRWETVIGDATVPYLTRPQEGMAGQIWKTREPLIVEHYAHWEQRIPNLDTHSIAAVVGVPIIWGDDFLGVLEVEGWEPGEYSESDADLLSLFAHQAAIALHNAQLFQAERNQRELAEALTEALLAVSATLDLDQTLDRILEQVARVVKGDAFNIMSLERDGSLRVLRHRGYEALGLEAHIREFRLSLEDSVACKTMLANKEPVVFDDVTEIPGWTQISDHEYLRSYVAAPIQIEGEITGFLNVDGCHVGQFDAEDARRLQLFANHISMALEQARLFHAEREQRKMAEALTEAAFAVSSTLDFEQVLDHILEQIAHVLTGDTFNIMLVERGVARIARYRGYERFDSEDFVKEVTFPISEVRNLREMQESGEPVVIEDTQTYAGWVMSDSQPWLRSYIGAPIQIEDETVGYLNADSTEPHHFSAEDAHRLQIFANYVATAIKNARLFDETQRRVAELEALQRVLLRLTSTLNLSDVLDTVAESVLSITQAGDCHIFLYDEEEETFTFGAALWEDGRQTPFTQQPRREGLTATVVQTAAPLIINDAQNHPLYSSEETRSWGLHAIAGFPLKWRGRVLGAMNVAFLEPHVFTEAEIRVLGLLADHAAIAIENAQLHRQVLNHAVDLERRVAQRTHQLQVQYARLQAILNNTSDGLVLTDERGAIIHTNPVAQHLFEKALPPEEAAELRKAIRNLARQAEQHAEQVLEVKGLDLQLKAVPITEEGGEGMAVVNIHDITHLNAIHRMRAQFISNVSHELRTPATTIKLYAELLQDAPPEKRRSYLDALITEAERQAKLVEDILHISHIDAGRLAIHPRPTSLNALTEEVVGRYEMLAQEAGLTLTYRPFSNELTVPIDEDNFELVISNLLRNALQYTAAGGEVTVTTAKDRREERTWATLTITDTGIGIPAEELPHIFERFFRGRVPQELQISGTGLGLAIVKHIVDLHGGLVTVESDVDKGSTFTVWMPLAAPA